MQGNIAQKNMQDMLQLKILGHDENLSKIARKKYVRTANLKMPSGKVEIGLDESKSCLYGVVLDQTTKRIGIQHLGDIIKKYAQDYLNLDFNRGIILWKQEKI